MTLTSNLEPLARIGVATLFNSLWEALLIALAVWLVLRLAPNASATTRYAAWAAGLCAAVILPVLTTLPHISIVNPASHLAQAAATWVDTAPASHRNVIVAPNHGAPLSRTVAASLPARMQFSVPRALVSVPFVFWALIAFAIVVRLVFGLLRLESLKRDALPVPPQVRDDLSGWERVNKGPREVRLCSSDRVNVPVAVGLFDSMILIPKGLLDTLSARELDQISLHELAHLRRGDDWTNCVQRVIEALLFFNPAILWIARQLDIEREVACDDWVVANTGEVRPYAMCLTHMAEVTAWPHRALAAPGVFVTRRSLSLRVERLLRAGRNIRTRIAFGQAGIVLVVLVAMFFLAQTIAPSIAFTLPQQPVIASQPATHRASSAHQTNRHALTPVVASHPSGTYNVMTTYQMSNDSTVRPNATVPSISRPTTSTSSETASNAAIVSTEAIRKAIASSGKIGSAEQRAAARAAARASAAVRQVPSKIAFAGSEGLSCTGCNFSGADWSNRNFKGANLQGSSFKDANLRNADFSSANLEGVDFEGADLRGANFLSANLSGANLRHADITGVNFANANLTGCQVTVATLAPSQVHSILESCRGCDFRRADLHDQDLRGISLTGVDLSEADLRGADLRGAHLNGVDLARAKLAGARLSGATLNGCDLSGTDLRNVDLTQVQLEGSNLSGAIMR